MKIKINEGKFDRIVRVIITASLFVFAIFFAQGTAQVFCLIFAAIMAITTLFGWCPLYILFGFSTCGKENAQDEDDASAN